MTEKLSRPHAASAMERAHIERSPRRVRTYFGGKLIADSDRVLLVYESKRPPAYWFPIADVRVEHLEKKDDLRQGGDTVRWRVAVRDRVAQNAARAYIKPACDRAALEGHLTFYWDQMDAWFEEDEEIFVHPRDPYTRVDTVHSSRHVRVEIDGVTLGETHRPMVTSCVTIRWCSISTATCTLYPTTPEPRPLVAGDRRVLIPRSADSASPRDLLTIGVLAVARLGAASIVDVHRHHGTGEAHAGAQHRRSYRFAAMFVRL